MYKASANTMLPTSIIGSLPRPAWYTAVLGSQSFLEAMVNSRYREQYEDAVSVFLRAQETAGLDIVTDGDAHYDEEVAGMSWQSYALRHMSGFDKSPTPTVYNLAPSASRAARSCTIRSRRGCCRKRGGPDRPRQSAIRRDVENRAASHPEAGQVRHDHARTAGRDRDQTTITRTRSSAPWRCPAGDQRGIARARRCRLPGDPDGRAANPHGAGARPAFGRLEPGRAGQDLQQHGQRACAPRPRSGAIPAGATRRSSACSATCRATSRRSTP